MNIRSTRAWLLSGLLALAALPVGAQERSGNVVTYDCANGRSFRAEFNGDRVRIRADLGLGLTLRRNESGSGRYSNGLIVLNTQGREATLEAAGQRLFDDCTAREGSVLPGGTEPVRPPGSQVNARYDCDSSSRNYPDRRDVDAREAERLLLQRENGQFIYRCTLTRSETSRVTGVVTYRQRIALPDDAVVEVELQDVSRADTGAGVIARETIETDGRQVPISFELDYNPEDINPRRTYTVRARIVIDGRTRWTSTESYPVITRDRPIRGLEIVVTPVRN